MKRQITIASVTLALIITVARSAAQFPDEVRQALQLCSEDIRVALTNNSGIPKDQTIAILPIYGDVNDYVIGIVKNSITGAGLQCVFALSDPFIKEIIDVGKELSDRKEDILDKKTLIKFGKLKGPKLFMSGTLREATGGNGRCFVELELHLYSAETGEHIWGKIFAKRFYSAPDVQGIVDLDPDVIKLIRDSLESIRTKIGTSSKLIPIHSVAIVPLAGDIDRFVTGVVEGMISQTRINPKQLDFSTLGEARAIIRENPQIADGLLYGAVRDLSRKLIRLYPDHKEYEISAAVQLSIQDVKTGDVLWSDTFVARGIDKHEYSWWEVVCRYVPYLILHKWWILAPVLALFGLVVLFMILRMLRRAR